MDTEKKFTEAAKRVMKKGVGIGTVFTADVIMYPMTECCFDPRSYAIRCTGEAPSKNKGRGFATLEFRCIVSNPQSNSDWKEIRITASNIVSSTIKLERKMAAVATTVEGLTKQLEHAEQSLVKAKKNADEIQARLDWCAQNQVVDFNEKVYLASVLIDSIKSGGTTSTIDVATKLVDLLQS